MDRQTAGFRKKFEAAGKRQGWLQSASILAAVSGGGDSVALLWLLKNFYKGKIAAAHIDHCTRNGASHRDADFVRKLCEKWDIPCFVKEIDVEKEKRTGESFEMAARRIRYEFFDELVAAEKFDFIALGHNLDDLVETQLLNLFRGTGIDGLRGIPEVRGRIVRPVIDFRRDELRKILSAREISWCEDETNAGNTYKRNKIRNDLIPWIKENMNANFEISMAALARQAAELSAVRNAKAETLLADISCENGTALAAWRRNAVKGLADSDISELSRLQGKKLGLPVLDRKRTEELVRLAKAGGRWRFQWAADIEVCRTAEGIFWLHRADAERI